MIAARWRALLRLLEVQASWTYERMAGIGVGHAAEPLLSDLYRDRDEASRRAAMARSAEYFNSHPYLAGVAVGAVVQAEREGVPGPTISRLRTALSGPLGSLGDQLIWAGEVPALMALALALVPWLGWWAVVIVPVVHNVLRLRLTLWGLDLGLREGLRVGGALERSHLPRLAGDAQRLAAVLVGVGVPIIGAWLLVDGTRTVTLASIGGALGGVLLMLAPATRTRVTATRFGLVLVLVTLLLIGVAQ